jgi:ribose transport system substrate-binding protein
VTGLTVVGLAGLALSLSFGVAEAAGASASAGVAHAKQVVQSYSGKVSGYDTPTVAVKGLAKFKGKTVMYIPLLQAVPAFAITSADLQRALATVGLKLTVCNGEANPTGVANCLSQAESQGMAGVVTDSIPYVMAANAFNTATSKGLPILITDQIAQAGTVGKDLQYMPGNINQPTLLADWMIADSKGKANVLLGEEADSPSAIDYVTLGELPEFKKYCPGCKVKTVDIPLDPTQITSTVNSAIAADPGASYYEGEFEDQMQNALSGLQQAGKAGSVKAAFDTGTIAGLTYMKQHRQVYAEIGDDVAYQGWAAADEMLRMLAGQKLVTENIPERIFTRTNVGTVDLTSIAQTTGQWYGNPNSYEASFEKLWKGKS